MYRSYDMHLNVFWNYNGKPHWENNITKAFINTFQNLNLKQQIKLLNENLNLELNYKNNITFGFELQNLRADTQQRIKENNYNKYLMTLNPSGETWDKDAEKILDKISKKISNKNLNFHNLTDDQLIKKLKELNLINEEQKDDEELIEDVLETINIISNRGGSIPDAWILIGKNDELDTVIAIETKLWDLNPYQNDNHLKKSLGISINNSKAIKKVKFYDLCETINNISQKTKITKDFITYMDWLGYYNKFNCFETKDIEFKKINDTSINVLERKWNNFFNYYFHSREYERLEDELKSKFDENNKRIWFKDIDNLNIYFNTYQGEDLCKDSGLFVGSEIGVKSKNIPINLGKKINKNDIKKLKKIYKIKGGSFSSQINKRLHSHPHNWYFKYFISEDLIDLFNEFLSDDHKIYENTLTQIEAFESLENLKSKYELNDYKKINDIIDKVHKNTIGTKKNGIVKSYYDLLSYLRFVTPPRDIGQVPIKHFIIIIGGKSKWLKLMILMRKWKLFFESLKVKKHLI